MSWLTRWSLRNGSVVTLAVVAILVFGAFAVVCLRQEPVARERFRRKGGSRATRLPGNG